MDLTVVRVGEWLDLVILEALPILYLVLNTGFQRLVVVICLGVSLGVIGFDGDVTCAEYGAEGLKELHNELGALAGHGIV